MYGDQAAEHQLGHCVNGDKTQSQKRIKEATLLPDSTAIISSLRSQKRVEEEGWKKNERMFSAFLKHKEMKEEGISFSTLPLPSPPFTIPNET